MRKHLWLLLLFLALLALPILAKDDAPRPSVMGSPAGNDGTSGDDDGDDEPEIVFSALAEAFRDHCVRVFVHGRSDEGRSPTTLTFDEDIRHERPTPIGGYWWDDRHVVIPDPVIQDRYIRSIEVQIPNDNALYRARIVGRFVKLQALLLEVIPDEDGSYPAAHPLKFVDGDLDEALAFSYAFREGNWRIYAKGGLGEAALTDGGVETVAVGDEGVLLDHLGNPVGLAFGDKLRVDHDNDSYWAGEELHSTPILSRDNALQLGEKLSVQLANAVLETRFRIRVKIDDDDEENAMWAMNLDETQAGTAKAEVRAAGLVVGKRHLLVPVALDSDSILRIEEIVVTTASGQELQADFVGALREYMAVLVEVKENLPTDALPKGFGLLNPMSGPGVPERVLQESRPEMDYFARWRVDYAVGRRRETADYDRWLGTFRGYRGDTLVLTRTNEEDGSLAFDIDGNLAAVALTPRLIRSREPGLGLDQVGSPAFRPLDFLVQKLTADDVFDPFLMPVDEDQGQRLVDMGVEVQALDANTAKLFHVTRESRGGRIGVLVTHVYPESIADRIGLQEHDVLLRIMVEGRNEPMELRSSNYAFQGAFDSGDMASDSFQSMLRYMPPPWPSRENIISTLLTGAGPGKKATVEFMREGEVHSADFVTGYFEPDYRNAKKERFTALGLTIKPITFEVARYFGKSDQSGVIVSKAEDGGKGSVAGLHHYLLITHVDGQAVANPDDFRQKVSAFENGEAKAVELTVEGFGKTRLVKIE
ncbi:MAG: hypothetical protein LUC93_04645 [Planctomycetaceae bacterium]|nr:hypothetical protein [Planctomycetaceae bacterium]